MINLISVIVILGLVALAVYCMRMSNSPKELETSMYENPLHTILVTEPAAVDEKELEDVKSVTLPFDFDENEVPESDAQFPTETEFVESRTANAVTDFVESRTSDNAEFVSESNNTYPEAVAINLMPIDEAPSYHYNVEVDMGYVANNNYVESVK